MYSREREGERGNEIKNEEGEEDDNYYDKNEENDNVERLMRMSIKGKRAQQIKTIIAQARYRINKLIAVTEHIEEISFT